MDQPLAFIPPARQPVRLSFFLWSMLAIFDGLTIWTSWRLMVNGAWIGAIVMAALAIAVSLLTILQHEHAHQHAWLLVAATIVTILLAATYAW